MISLAFLNAIPIAYLVIDVIDEEHRRIDSNLFNFEYTKP